MQTFTNSAVYSAQWMEVLRTKVMIHHSIVRRPSGVHFVGRARAVWGILAVVNEDICLIYTVQHNGRHDTTSLAQI